MQINVLVVDDNANMRIMLRADLERLGHSVHEAGNGVEALLLLERKPIDVVITDLKMPEMDGKTLLSKAKPIYPDVLFIMISAHGTIQDAVEAMKLGAADYITKPFETSEIERIMAKSENQVDNASEPLLFPASGKKEMIGKSRLMEEIRGLIERVAASDATVLILGESGTGKELVARAIHEESPRKAGPFIAVNCAAFAEGILESELFGHEKGAFTGAASMRAGRFELADRGTLFLDEIGDISPAVQVKLLRVLQERSFERVGGVREIKSDFRLITATNRDIGEEIKNKRFREDLYYRISIVPITLPPLRERREDIPLLIDYFIHAFNRRLKTKVQGISPKALGKLMACQWPGNIRELENVIERTMVFTKDSVIDEADLPPQIQQNKTTMTGSLSPATDIASGGLKDTIKNSVAALEKEYLIAALTQESSNRTNTAKRLGISRKSLQLKIKEYCLEQI